MDKVTERKIKLLLSSKTKERKDFEKQNHCFMGVWSGYTDSIDWWLRLTNDNHVVNFEVLQRHYMPFSIRARMQLGHTFAVWLPNELADKLKYPEDTDSCKDIIMKHSFNI
jgi:hypothetical protein